MSLKVSRNYLIIFKVLYIIGMVFGIFPFKYKATANRVEKSVILTIYTNILFVCSVLIGSILYLPFTMMKKGEGLDITFDFALIQNIFFYLNIIQTYYNIVSKQTKYIQLINRMLELLEVVTIRNDNNLKMDKLKATLLKFVILDTLLFMPMLFLMIIVFDSHFIFFLHTMVVFLIALVIRFLSSIIFLGYNCFELMFSELNQMIQKSVNSIEGIQKYYNDLTSYEYELKCDRITDEIEKYTEIYIQIVACSSNFSSMFSKFSLLLLFSSFLNFMIEIFGIYTSIKSFAQYYKFISVKTIYTTSFVLVFLISLELGQMFYLITTSTKIEEEHEKLKRYLKVNVEKMSKNLTLSVRMF